MCYLNLLAFFSLTVVGADLRMSSRDEKAPLLNGANFLIFAVRVSVSRVVQARKRSMKANRTARGLLSR